MFSVLTMKSTIPHRHVHFEMVGNHLNECSSFEITLSIECNLDY